MCEERDRRGREEECHGHRPEGERREDCRREDESGIEATIRNWQDAYEHACREVQIDILKEKIRKAWGKSMDSVADAVVELMHKDWEAAQGGDKARDEREKLLKDLVAKIAKAYEKGPR